MFRYAARAALRDCGPPISSTSSESVAHQRLNEPNPLLDNLPVFLLSLSATLDTPITRRILRVSRSHAPCLTLDTSFRSSVVPCFSSFALTLCRASGAKFAPTPIQTTRRPPPALLGRTLVPSCFSRSSLRESCEFSESVRRGTVQPHADTPRRWIRRVRDEGRISGDSADFEPLYVSRPRL